MASILPTLFLLLLLCDSIPSSEQWAHTFLHSDGAVKRPIGEKTSRLRFFFHDVVTGPSPTAVRVAQATGTATSAVGFGAVAIIDDPLTVGPEPTSKLVGRAQGLYAEAGKDSVGLLMAMNFAFVDGTYNGSTLAVLGRNDVFSAVREMPVVGGSGAFRFARGYAEARTNTFDTKSGNAVVEYNVFVSHY